MGHCSDIFTGGRGMMRGGMLGMGILWWIFIVIVIVAVVYLMKNKTNQQLTNDFQTQKPIEAAPYPSALEILDQEFAKGNITEEEYLHRKERLKQ